MSNSRIVRTASVLLLGATIAFPVSGFACGESLYRVGKGVAYRGYSAPIPATVIVYHSAETSESLASALAAAGHDVRLVRGEAELAAALRDADIDVVLGPVSIAAALGDTANHTFLPIVAGGDAAAARYPRVLRPDDDLKTYLKQIHRSLARA
ncbi:MAG: hypothetical protein AAFX58_04080 [Pseudomonadota bacterium]